MHNESPKNALVERITAIAAAYIEKAEGDPARAVELAREDCAGAGHVGDLALKCICAAIDDFFTPYFTPYPSDLD